MGVQTRGGHEVWWNEAGTCHQGTSAVPPSSCPFSQTEVLASVPHLCVGVRTPTPSSSNCVHRTLYTYIDMGQEYTYVKKLCELWNALLTSGETRLCQEYSSEEICLQFCFWNLDFPLVASTWETRKERAESHRHKQKVTWPLCVHPYPPCMQNPQIPKPKGGLRRERINIYMKFHSLYCLGFNSLYCLYLA